MSGDFEVELPSCTRRVFFGFASSLRSASGALRGAIGVFVDPIDRNRASDQLRRREAQLSRALEASNDGYWEWEAATRQVFVSGRGRAIAGLPAAQAPLTDAQVRASIHPEDRERVGAVLRPLIQGRSGSGQCEVELRLARPDGAVVWVLARAAVTTRDARGRALQLSGAITDVTERRRAEDALPDASRRKDEFPAMLSHELRNPLALIRNGVFVLDRAPAGSEPARRALEVIEGQVMHMSRLVDDLLDVTRITRGKVQLQLAPLALDELVRR